MLSQDCSSEYVILLHELIHGQGLIMRRAEINFYLGKLFEKRNLNLTRTLIDRVNSRFKLYEREG